MFHPISIYIGLRYLRGRSGDRFSRFVSFMSTAGITIGVLALITVTSVMNGFEGQLKGRILGVLPHAVVSQDTGKTVKSSPPPEFLSQYPSSLMPVPIVRSEAVIQSPVQLSAGMLLGVDPTLNDPIGKHLLGGKLERLEQGEYKIFLGHTLARQLKVRIGDKVRIMVTGASRFTPLGRIPSQRNFTVAGVFNTGSDVDAQLMIANINDAGRLLRFSSDTITGWRLTFDDPFIVSEYANAPLPNGWKWSDWREQRGELFQAVKMEKNMMGLMLGLIVAVAAFNIISALIMVVMEKQAEVAILKTQGLSNYQVMTVFMVQGASSGIIGSLVGGFLGIALAININDVLEAFNLSLFAVGGELPVLINYSQVFTIIILAVALSIIATLYPSYRASSVKPAEALRYE
ncbi:lipoprotein-releasing ABC transporter permease subunit LolC [Vibrio sp. S9_S30]|uniref:lipoprotein-releasing ABC transporter permease subunit LolC n=1 Tax=Vibrio sp. S9_S30 TaxID=2720226 RepID=UPI001680A2F3|nr:lipoprotein-releasing ABC transporter permease subunit LolC [Vibrio sp. S9_S30]MBD1556520.1 lipoprotein-releasing ABC transporter permease subunit LolC [Vibrio sp. S9_S30]